MPLTCICFQKHSIITWRAVKSQEWKQIAFHWISVCKKIYQERNLFERQQLLKKPKSAIVIFLSVLKFWWINSQQCLSRLFSNQKNNKLVIIKAKFLLFQLRKENVVLNAKRSKKRGTMFANKKVFIISGLSFTNQTNQRLIRNANELKKFALWLDEVFLR